MPERIQRRRTKGWRLPPGVVYVGRPTVWQNPFGPPNSSAMVKVATRDEAVCEHRRMVEGECRAVGGIPGYILELRGRDVCCWCRLDQACHADLLLELANR